MCSGSFPDHVFWTWQWVSLPRVVRRVRKVTTPDEEFKIIIFSPTFVLHYINEVLWFVSLGRIKIHTGAYQILCFFNPHSDLDVTLKDFTSTSSVTVLSLLPLTPSPAFVFSLLFTIFARELLGDWKKNSRKIKKVSNFHSVTHRDRGDNGTQIIRESGLSLCVWRPSIQCNPYCIGQFPNLINYHQQTLLYQQLVDNTMVLSTVGW